MKLTTDHLVKLLAVKGVGRAKVFRLTELINFRPGSDVELAEALIEQIPALKLTSSLSKTEILNSFRAAGDLLEESRRIGIKTISYFDSEFPLLLKDIDTPPIVLHILGNWTTLSMPTVAVIGTREPSIYGQRVGERVGYRLGERNIHVISGLAIGCDTTAHIGCLKAGGITSAVLAHGLDSLYPKENKGLADKILEAGGCLVSEYMLKVRAIGNYFVERDRLQAGLSKATIVIETDIKGGTMHTVKDTLAYGRILMTVNHPPDKQNEKSRGNQMLLREGKAKPLETKEDVDALIDRIAPQQAPAAPLAEFANTSLADMQLPLYNGENFTTVTAPKEKTKKPRKKRTKPGAAQSKAFNDESDL